MCEELENTCHGNDSHLVRRVVSTYVFFVGVQVEGWWR